MFSPSWEHKKAGFFHRPPEEHTFLGAEAQREISRRLAGFPRAQQLSREVYGFYGDRLHFTESESFTSDFFTLRLQHHPLALESAEIQLQLRTERVAEALAHELLHLRLFTLGFPLGEIVHIPFPGADYARDFIGMCHWVLNLVHHEMNYRTFIALGFDKNHFLIRSNEVIDYRERLRVDFPMWCIDCLRHFFAARHGGDEGSLAQAREALNWGSRLYPELRRVIAEIGEWFEMGAFKDPFQYPSQLNFLLELMKIPKFTGWAMLESSAPGSPVAVRLQEEKFRTA